MKAVRVPVVCSECGKRLKGVERLRGLGFHVSRHKRADGTECWGSKRTDHLRVMKHPMTLDFTGCHSDCEAGVDGVVHRPMCAKWDGGTETLMVGCEGSGGLLNAVVDVGVSGIYGNCQMCHKFVRSYDGVAGWHLRVDVLAMLERGDFDNG